MADETDADEETVYGIHIFYTELIVRKRFDENEYETDIWNIIDERYTEPYDFEKLGREGFWVENSTLSERGIGTYVCPAQILRIEDPFRDE